MADKYADLSISERVDAAVQLLHENPSLSLRKAATIQQIKKLTLHVEFDDLSIRHLRTSIERTNNGRGYYGATEHGSMTINIQRRTLRVDLVNSGILRVSLNVFNDVKVGCFGAVFMMIRRALEYFRRKNEGALKKQHIENISSLLLTVRYERMEI
jgi:hypothetical protein